MASDYHEIDEIDDTEVEEVDKMNVEFKKDITNQFEAHQKAQTSKSAPQRST